MAFNLTRMTVYALISSLEEDLRQTIADSLKIEDLDENLCKRTTERLCKELEVSPSDYTPSIDDLTEFMDLGDTFQSINASKSQFPEHIAKHIKSNTAALQKLVPIRNRVMHIRPLQFEDFPTVTNTCKKLSEEESSIWPKVKSTLERLEVDPSFVLSLDIPVVDCATNKKHNLPMPDFDETGLIGRDEDVKQVKQLCLGGFPVISIVGEGGVGKTALALKVAYELLEDESSPFDAIVWVTSKTTQITVNEISDIKSAISDSLGILTEIENQLIGEGLSNQNSFEEIVDYLATFRIALFIDNLETVLDDNIRQFIGALPQGSKIIITSRIGLGAFEYPVKLQGIQESFAAQLLRTLSKLRNVDSLQALPQKTILSYVNRMHRNPSYIKWFVSSIQTGLSPENVLQNSDLFLEFCMDNVYKFLSEDARHLTDSMQCAPGLKDIPELAFLTDFDGLRSQKAIQELMATNMMNQTSDTKGASVKTMYQLSDLAREYLGKYHKPSLSFQKQIRSKRNQLNSIFEKQMKYRTQNKYNPSNIKFRDKNDRVIAKMLTDAQCHMKELRYDRAFEILNEASRMAPDYFEVARVMGQFYEKQGNLTDARKQFELAIVLSSKSPQLHFWFGKYLLKSEENLDEALVQFNHAHVLDKESLDVNLALARAHMFKGEFDKTNKLLDFVSNIISDQTSHNNKIYLDTRIQVHYRQADLHTTLGNYEYGLVSLEQMRNLFDELPENFKDKYMRKKLSKTRFTFSKIQRNLPDVFNARVDSYSVWLNEEAIE
ncbi:ATP-binding protein [Vibrio parahaemolyticus]|uniref:tetratricopeptide repeat protein n=1 Tax=Vibrio parahaemolyticus TaxID=670 RepID=UPI0003FBA5E0|nr:NB-ARC domain-containing protein [Vibrio parahaemolyticus]KIT29938.1 hypothetical protein H323_20100 [Vibrio parahaemolyticus VP766]EGR2770749.1 ATP-binding protein [Vibrio parahaemolyticus]EGR2833415.1 ATP-binding protein [Vibrio parahaemolyticus]EGR2885998.1 ATP-binding protein [Vibrio parahaemolyticus]EGR2907953.1 ATP-binding protein [Vibrio parahaemolyticus]